MSFGEGVVAGVIGLGAAIVMLMIGGFAAEKSIAGRMKACMEISTSDQCMNQFIAENTRRPGN